MTLSKMAATTATASVGDTLEVMIGKEDEELLLFDDENGGKQETVAMDEHKPTEEPVHQNGGGGGGGNPLQHQYHSVQLSIDAEADEFNDEPASGKKAVEISLNASGLEEKEANITPAAPGDSLLANETLNSSTAGVIDLEISSKLNDEDEEEESAEKRETVETVEGQFEQGAEELPSESHSHQPHLTPQLSADFKYLYRNTRYFVIKSFNYENVNIAKEKSVWSTPRLNEIKLTKAYRVSSQDGGRLSTCSQLVFTGHFV